MYRSLLLNWMNICTYNALGELMEWASLTFLPIIFTAPVIFLLLLTP